MQFITPLNVPVQSVPGGASTVRYNGAKSTEFAGVAESVRVIKIGSVIEGDVTMGDVPVTWHVFGSRENSGGNDAPVFKVHV